MLKVLIQLGTLLIPNSFDFIKEELHRDSIFLKLSHIIYVRLDIPKKILIILGDGQN
jgi:hypothetical protein